MRFLILCFVVLLFISCKEAKEKELFINNKEAINNVDSGYNGVIKFYDKVNRRLLYVCHYKKGILEGEKDDFYSNGQLYAQQYYDNGKLNGNVFFYDSTGKLLSQQHFYYGIKVGPIIHFHSGEVNKYDFYSFDGELLFSLNYDLLRTKKITNIEDEFFFFHTNEFSNLDSLGKFTEYFIYLPQPPKFKFQYSVVKVDSAYNILSTEKEIGTNEVWSTFSFKSDRSKNYAIKLFIKDSINKVNYTMFKKI